MVFELKDQQNLWYSPLLKATIEYMSFMVFINTWVYGTEIYELYYPSFELFKVVQCMQVLQMHHISRNHATNIVLSHLNTMTIDI